MQPGFDRRVGSEEEREARDVVRASFEPVVYEPELSAGWQEARARFAELPNGAGLEVDA